MNGKGGGLNILWLWPDILNQHGERGNAMALVRICGLYGIEARVTRIDRLGDDVDFGSADIVLLGAGELFVMPRIVGALSKRFDGLKGYVDSGGILLATGTTGAALGVKTIRTDGSYVFGLGLLDMECRERETVLGDDLIYRVAGAGEGYVAEGAPTDMAVYGIQIHMMDVYLAPGQAPFGEVIYGYGNNGGRGGVASEGQAGNGLTLDSACAASKGATGNGAFEGAVYGGVIFTNALGPVLVKNPWLTLGLIGKALARKESGGGSLRIDPAIGGGAPHRDLTTGASGVALRFDPALFGIELASAKAIRIFNEKKEKPKCIQT